MGIAFCRTPITIWHHPKQRRGLRQLFSNEGHKWGASDDRAVVGKREPQFQRSLSSNGGSRWCIQDGFLCAASSQSRVLFFLTKGGSSAQADPALNVTRFAHLFTLVSWKKKKKPPLPNRGGINGWHGRVKGWLRIKWGQKNFRFFKLLSSAKSLVSFCAAPCFGSVHLKSLVGAAWKEKSEEIVCSQGFQPLLLLLSQDNKK